MSIHLAFDLLAYTTGGLLSLWFAKTHLWHRPGAVPQKSRLWYWLWLLQGGILGAFLIGTIELWLSGIEGMLGKSILGAIAGGILAIELYKKVEHIEGSTGLAFVPSLAAGIAVGRWGCFLTGLPDMTHGVPTSSALGYDFGDGIPRHPVQLYESFSMLLFLVVFLVMMRRENGFWRRNGFYLFAGFYGAQRFAWEFLKPYATLIGPFNFFHLLCAGLIAYALCMMRFHERLQTR
jgi:phosphatidylglycerol---prolipoprotein diacylglyceryl transferase